nr:hypothetical protein Iba_scaffold35105CG0110 [Ipomoea batatas]GMD02480.1 hypothetical protein Iba_scaffold38803CG0100 [Ipomoea batatas]GMD97373.1 hypothetical protein Iba_chr15cCG1980 [Ipomoea batatas]GMD99211.1 hypothetical protein Iba_chr15eCG1630 [Ipomoea batatas]
MEMIGLKLLESLRVRLIVSSPDDIKSLRSATVLRFSPLIASSSISSSPLSDQCARSWLKC